MQSPIIVVFSIVLLLAMPIYIMYRYRACIFNNVLIGLCKTITALCFSTFFIYFIFKWDNLIVNYVAIVLFSLVTSVVALRRARLNVVRYFIPVSISILFSALLIGSFSLLVVFGRNCLLHKYVVPVDCLLIINMSYVVSKALYTYYSGLKYHNQLYNYLLGNGATYAEALNFFSRRAIERSVSVSIRNITSSVGIVFVMFLTMFFCGIQPFMILAYVLVLFAALFSSSVLSVFISLWISKKYAFDRYSRFRP